MSSEIDIADWIQSSSAIKSHSSKNKVGVAQEQMTFNLLLVLQLHYQSGEDVVIVLCHHPHHLGLEEEEGEGGRTK